jgi:hypothetical protein
MKTDRTVEIYQPVPNDFLRTMQNQVFDIFFEITLKNANNKLHVVSGGSNFIINYSNSFYRVCLTMRTKPRLLAQNLTETKMYC